MISRSENASKRTVACCGATGKLFKISQHWAHVWKWIKGNNKTDNHKFVDLLIKEKEEKKTTSKIMMIKLRPIKRSLRAVVSISFVCCWIFFFSCWSDITVNEALCIYCDSLDGIWHVNFCALVQSLNINCALAFFCLKCSWSSSSRHATNTPNGRSSNDAYDGASTTWHDARWAW